MTTVYTSSLASSDRRAAETHVFIVGVGEYPCLVGGKGTLLEDTMGLGQLSSPPVSAAALASWFLGRQGHSGAAVGFNNPDAPLATVEMLLSPAQSYAGPGLAEVPVAAATHANIVQSFKLWKDRVAAHDGNVAVFYFCGHGVKGVNDYLLPSDFGALNPNNPWGEAIDIKITAEAMRRLSSGPLYFFIDACRKASRNVLLPERARRRRWLSSTSHYPCAASSE